MLKGFLVFLKNIKEGIRSEEIGEHGHCCDFGDCLCYTLEDNAE